MASIDLAETVKALKGERALAQKELVKLDKAISVLTDLSASNHVAVMANGHGHKRTMSAAARRKIAKAQRLRWAKVRREVS
jgi:hypothetical protein